ncbi:MAG TPA: hypothetical protein PKO15_08930 [Fibrobacteria bacterium]|nr:hypothetical protein [Fibrobacteria bacterium]HOX50859.1 hypothetical protein [Fibrobacteria bacterium]
MSLITRKAHDVSPESTWNLPGASEAFEGGRRALRAGFLDPAIRIFRALASRETREDVWLALAETELARGHVAQARTILAEIPSSIQRSVLEVECALAAEETIRALVVWGELSASAPRHPKVRFLEGRMMALGADFQEAEVIFLSLAADPEVGARACAWAVFCAACRGDVAGARALLANLRDDDAVCEGLREWIATQTGMEWTPSARVEPTHCRSWADRWTGWALRGGR